MCRNLFTYTLYVYSKAGQFEGRGNLKIQEIACKTRRYPQIAPPAYLTFNQCYSAIVCPIEFIYRMEVLKVILIYTHIKRGPDIF